MGSLDQIVPICMVLGLTMLHVTLIQAYREHKVHNIVLYPDKHSWCKTTTIKQVISYPGCTSVEIDNNVCVGACFSYSIPHTEPSDPGEVIVPYCDSCQPSETTWHPITLQCNRNDADLPPQLIKHVQIIENCSCTPCEKDRLTMSKFPENNEDLLFQQNADPELLDALTTRNKSNYNHVDTKEWKETHLFLNQKLVGLLKSIQANNTDEDKKQLLDLFNVIQEPMKHKAKAKNLVDFIETLQSNKTELDTPRLIELLLKFEHVKQNNTEKLDTKEEHFSNKHETAVHASDFSSELGKESTAIWIDTSPKQVASDLEAGPNLPILHERTPYEDVPDVPPQKVESVSQDSIIDEDHRHDHLKAHTHSHQHHVNDNVIAHGHLARGPHGALVIEPNRVHEKLDVNAHDLKPNHAGTLLSYHSHSKEDNILPAHQ